MPKLCAPSTYTLKCAFGIAQVASYAAPELLADTDFQEWRQLKVKADRKKTTSVFGFLLTADENIDFVTQYLANNRIFGDALVGFSCKYTFL